MTPRRGLPPGQRRLRVGEAVRHALSATLQRGEMRDPDLADVAVTVTEVRVSPDLRTATAFVLPLGAAGDGAALVAALNRAAPFLRRRVAGQVRLRYAPRLDFAHDSRFDHAGAIDRLLRDPAVARDLGPDDDDAAAGPPRAGGDGGDG